MAQEIAESHFNEKVIKADKPVLVDFFAEWCGPCKMLSPIIDEVSKEVEGKAHVYKVDVDKNPALANKYQVLSIPTLLFFKDGKVTNQLVGTVSKEDLIKNLT
jgi:thioredoxin 1